MVEILRVWQTHAKFQHVGVAVVKGAELRVHVVHALLEDALGLEGVKGHGGKGWLSWWVEC